MRKDIIRADLPQTIQTSSHITHVSASQWMRWSRWSDHLMNQVTPLFTG